MILQLGCTFAVSVVLVLALFLISSLELLFIRRIKKYLDYAGSGEWARYDEDNELPTVLLVVQNKSVHKRLRKRLAKELRESYEELTFATTRLEYILNPDYRGQVWFPVDEDGDDPDEALKPVTLARLPQADN